MKQTVCFSDFQDAFFKLRPDNFSMDGLGILWDYLERYEQELGEELELDVIAFCCEYSEEHWQDIADNYSIDLEGIEDEDEKKQAVMDYLCDNTSVCGETEDGSFVYQVF